MFLGDATGGLLFFDEINNCLGPRGVNRTAALRRPQTNGVQTPVAGFFMAAMKPAVKFAN
jgi:hypothetical protein